jgi:menaquinone-9 beta-reductase
VSSELRYDVVVVGARVAGAATAMLLARQGRRVLLLDKARFGQDTLSTHAIMRAGVMQLNRWGLLDRVVRAGTPPLRQTTFHYGGRDSTVVEIAPADGIDALYAPRRTVLDPIMVEAAEEAGADVRFQMRVEAVIRDGQDRAVGVIVRDGSGRRVSVSAELVVGADGIRSRVAESVGAPVERRGRSRSGVIYAYHSRLPVDGNEWHYGNGAAAGLIPTNDDQTCVFVSTDASRFHREMRTDVGAGFSRLLEEAGPGLVDRVGASRAVGALRSFPGVAGFLRRATGPGWALVGDAGYFKDPITAHGIADALRDAELLARSVDDGDTERYQRQRDAVSASLFDVTDEIAGYRWGPAEIRTLLLELSRSMRPEVELLRGLWADADGPAPAVA